MFGFRRGDLAEAVPPGYENLPIAPGWHEIRPDTISDVDRICRMLGVAANDAFRPGTMILGCAVPSIHAVIMPAPGVLDPEKQQAEQDHEFLHSWGAVHSSGGRGWFNLPALTNVFAQQPADPAAGNVFAHR